MTGPALTPGAFLRRRREELSLTVEMLALATETTPAICARSRAEWLEAIEADLAPISVRTGVALHAALGFDVDVLDALIELHGARGKRPLFAGPIEFVAPGSAGGPA